MKTYIKFITINFLKSFLFVSLIFFSIVIILNILTEIEFFKEIKTKPYISIYTSLLNSPSLLFEMFPFIFLVSTQSFFINLFNNNQIQIFKYSGLKNSKILSIISLTSFIVGIFIIIFFYSFSSSLKNIYLEIKNKYTTDDKYLAVITNNGLWIKDSTSNQINIIHASKIDNNFLIDTFISQFNHDFKILRHIKSSKIDISNQNWIIYDGNIFSNDSTKKSQTLEFYSNFNYEKIQSLFSNLSSLSIIKLYELRENYKLLNYSTTEVELQLQKILSYPFYLMVMTILSSIIMFNTKKFNSNILKISIGLFFSVIIYYINNFFMVLGKSEKIPIMISVWIPLMFLLITVSIFSYKINEK
jgi:lipopolysaccharide export system permease protein